MWRPATWEQRYLSRRFLFFFYYKNRVSFVSSILCEFKFPQSVLILIHLFQFWQNNVFLNSFYKEKFCHAFACQHLIAILKKTPASITRLTSVVLKCTLSFYFIQVCNHVCSFCGWITLVFISQNHFRYILLIYRRKEMKYSSRQRLFSSVVQFYLIIRNIFIIAVYIITHLYVNARQKSHLLEKNSVCKRYW